MKEDCTYFDKHTSFKGTISTPDEVVVEGHVRGEVTAARKVTILSGAEVRGPIRTARFLLQEGAYHLGVLSLSDRPDAISLSALSRLRNVRFATSPPATSPPPARKNGKSATETPVAGKEKPGQDETPETAYQSREKKRAQEPESRSREKESREEEPVPAGFAGDPDPSDRLW